MTDAFAAVESGAMGSGATTAVAILLLLGAMGKSAQFPFHVWLPDAMEGPTPVSALIHAATMVIAGVYLVARAYPIFAASPEALTVVASVGVVTALGAATIALVSTDLKRILAYSTVSHLGLMMLSLGALGWTAAVFHLMAHGFAKALLFLGAGSVMHGVGAHGDVDIRRVGGLRRAMPLTAAAFSVGALSLGGIPILSGFWSKDEILLSVSENLPAIFIVLAFLTAFLSALYMARAMFVVFFGPEGEDTHHAHESPILMTSVLSVLAILAIGFGWIAFNWPGAFGGFGDFVFYGYRGGFHFNVLGRGDFRHADRRRVRPGLAGVRATRLVSPGAAGQIRSGFARGGESILRGRDLPVVHRPRRPGRLPRRWPSSIARWSTTWASTARATWRADSALRSGSTSPATSIPTPWWWPWESSPSPSSGGSGRRKAGYPFVSWPTSIRFRCCCSSWRPWPAPS